MINSLNLYKLLVGNTIPTCVNCVHFKPGVISEGYCKLFGNILQARITNAQLCGLDAKEFKQVSFVKKSLNDSMSNSFITKSSNINDK